MARVRHAARWRPAGAAATFVLAAVAGVVGNQLTGHLTVALVVFVVLLAAGMAVTFLLERHADGRAAGEDQGAGDAGARADIRLARRARVQVGDGNRQTNYFGALGLSRIAANDGRAAAGARAGGPVRFW